MSDAASTGRPFDGRAVVVTGASSGIGRAVAIELARAGAALWLVGRSTEELDRSARLIGEAGGSHAVAVPLDLRERGALAQVVATVARDHPYLFALVNNAGLMHPEPVMQGTMARWQAMLDVNVLALLEGTQAAVHAMRAHGRPAHIVNVGSVAARWEEPGVYGATKQMVAAIGASLRRELERDDIRVTTVVPGGFATQLARGLTADQLATVERTMTTMVSQDGPDKIEKMLGDPQHIANAVRYVLEQPIAINFQEIVIRPPVDTKI